MAVVEGPTEIHRGRTGSQSLEVNEYTRIYWARTDDATDTAAVVLATANPHGTVFPDDTLALLVERDARQDDDSRVFWIISERYSTERGESVVDNPLDDPADITWGTERFQVPAFKDRNNEGITNSAGDPVVNPPAMKDESRLTVNIRKNSAFVPTWIVQYRDAVNSDAVLIDGIAVAPGNAKVVGVGISGIRIRNQIAYRIVDLRIALSEDGWAITQLDKGTRKLDSGGTGREQITNDDGTEPAYEVLLDGAGAVLSDPDPSNAVFLEFDVYKELPFSVLPLF